LGWNLTTTAALRPAGEQVRLAAAELIEAGRTNPTLGHA
jgi:hypothetical protein